MVVCIEVPDLAELVEPPTSDRTPDAKGIEAATITAINFAEGDEIQEGEIFALISNRRGIVEIISPASGIIIEIRCEEGDAVEEDEVVAIVDLDE